MYQALYRKYRPRFFREVIGQEPIVNALQNQIAGDKIGHAYLFTGTRGTGKTTCARIFAKAVNCENKQGGEPCGLCEPCLGIEEGSILDVFEIDAASNNGVDDIRSLREAIVYRPSRCQFRVYIIDEVHMLSQAAFDAFLKIMEEPPSHVIFILATTEIHKVPATIQSRCQRFDFMRISVGKISDQLLRIAQLENIALIPGAARLIARLADGALRDALSVLDTCSGIGDTVDEALVRKMTGVADQSYLFDISAALAKADAPAALLVLDEQHEHSMDMRRLCEELVYHYRNQILALAVNEENLLAEFSQEELGKYKQQAILSGKASVLESLRVFAEARDRMGRSPNPRIELELAFFAISMRQENDKSEEGVANFAGLISPKTTGVVRPPSKKTSGLQEETTPPTKPASAKPILSEPLPERGLTPPAPTKLPATEPTQKYALFPQWDTVLQQIQSVNMPLYTLMKGSIAYCDEQRVYIKGKEIFLEYMRTDAAAKEIIRKAIFSVSGVSYALGPYKEEMLGGKATSRDVKTTLEQWKAKGVPVEYK